VVLEALLTIKKSTFYGKNCGECGSDFLKMYFCVRPPSKPCFASTNEPFYVKNVVLGALLIVQKVLSQEIPTTFSSKVKPPGPEKDFHYFFSKKKV